MTYRIQQNGHVYAAYSDLSGGVNPRWDNLLAGWKLDESSDGSGPVPRVDVLDVYELTDVNTTPSVTDPTFGEVAEFHKSSNEYLQYAVAGNGLELLSTFTGILWWRPTATYPFNGLIYQQFVGSKQWNLSDNSNNAAFTYNSVTAQTNPDVPITHDVWHFLAFWMDASNVPHVQVDDGTVYDGSGPATLISAVFNVTGQLVGYQGDGRMRGLYLFDVVKDSAWRTDMYNGGAGREYPN